MQVTNNSDVNIPDDAIISIVKNYVRINVWSRTSAIKVTESRHVILQVGVIDPDIPDLLCVGMLGACWGIYDFKIVLAQ